MVIARSQHVRYQKIQTMNRIPQAIPGTFFESGPHQMMWSNRPLAVGRTVDTNSERFVVPAPIRSRLGPELGRDLRSSRLHVQARSRDE